MPRCPNGTRRNKKTMTCEPIKTVKSVKSVAPVKDDYNMFNMLCKKHIMVPTLDNVVKTTWMYNNDSNIFLIGEIHDPHTKCTGILNMLKSLIKENSQLPNRPEIDFFLELTQFSSTKMLATTQNQMSHIRVFLLQCIKERNCTIRVHWADPTQTNHKDNIPQWLQELSKVKLFTDEWTKNPLIREQLKTEKDITKLITENRFVMKEIEKAEQVNKKFTLAFVKRLFLSMWQKSKEKYGIDWTFVVKMQLRYVMDFYSVARIIKSKMKHVIYYAGNIHTDNAIQILSELNFYQKQQVLGECLN